MKFETWNVRSFYGPGSPKTVPGKLQKYKLDLLAVQEVRWDKGDSETADDNTLSMEMGMVIIT
jgi:exonuclease III